MKLLEIPCTVTIRLPLPPPHRKCFVVLGATDDRVQMQMASKVYKEWLHIVAPKIVEVIRALDIVPQRKIRWDISMLFDLAASSPPAYEMQEIIIDSLLGTHLDGRKLARPGGVLKDKRQVQSWSGAVASRDCSEQAAGVTIIATPILD